MSEDTQVTDSVRSVADWSNQAIDRLIESGIEVDEASRSVQFMLEDLAGISRLKQQIDPQLILNTKTLKTLEIALERRESRTPLSHILGEWEFWGLPFIVNTHVLTPRPDTEVLVEEALSWLTIYTHIHHQQNAQRPHILFTKRDRDEGDIDPFISVLDVGTGTGCIGLSLAHEKPNLCVTLIDLSTEALSVAEHNLTTLSKRGDIQGRVSLLESDLLDAVKTSHVDLIVSNPPYIRECEMSSLMPEVTRHEPHLALIGGGLDGLALVKRLADEAYQRLKEHGALIVEVGWDQTEETAHILRESGFTEIWIRKDYAGHPRVVGGVKPAHK